MRNLLLRGKIWLMVTASGGGLFVLGGCDPEVRDTMLSGAESAATTLMSTIISAFFQSVLATEEETATTVKAFIEQIPEFLA